MRFEKYLLSEAKNVPSGLLQWVKDYIMMRKLGNVAGAKAGKTAIDKEIKKLGLKSDDVYKHPEVMNLDPK
jgi:hypothetical protein